ncbi:MAG: hypothetical protein HOP29_12045 [Phycisphaerales bacterium]|nr:hypothetical protein [Phycisphaerales bacterium]
MADTVVVACPTCAQKYRVDESRVGHRAQCKHCGQQFRIQTHQAIDDETILGWVMDEESPDQSVMGSTSIFVSPTPSAVSGATQSARPTLDDWSPNTPPDKPRVRFDRIDEMGAYFDFPTAELRQAGVRASFPYKCLHCVRTDSLEVRLIIWEDKLPRQDSFHRQDLETKALGRLDQMLRTHQRRWFDQLEPMAVLPSPYCNPFPYFVCRHCGAAGGLTCRVIRRDGEEHCQIAISNLEIASEFYFNNGGKATIGYQRLVEAAQRQRNDRWQRLSFPVRTRIAGWYKPKDNEKFVGYFADAEFSRTEAGKAGVVLTDRRLIFKKYATIREFDVVAGGRLDIDANTRAAVIRISQAGAREAQLNASPVAASHLAKAITALKTPWQIKVTTATMDSSTS